MKRILLAATALLPVVALADPVPTTNSPSGVCGVVYNGGSIGPCTVDVPHGYDWQWNTRLFYSATQTATDPGQHVSAYMQTVRYGTTKSQLWGAVIDAHDMSGLPSSATGVMQGLEIDMIGNGADDNTAMIGRSGLVILFGQAQPGLPYEAGRGISLVGNGATVRRAVAVGLPVSEAAYDLHEATVLPGAKAFWGKDNAPVALDTTGVATIRWDSSYLRFKVSYNGTDIFSIDRSGNVRARGSVIQNVAP